MGKTEISIENGKKKTEKSAELNEEDETKIYDESGRRRQKGEFKDCNIRGRERMKYLMKARKKTKERGEDKDWKIH